MTYLLEAEPGRAGRRGRARHHRAVPRRAGAGFALLLAASLALAGCSAGASHDSAASGSDAAATAPGQAEGAKRGPETGAVPDSGGNGNGSNTGTGTGGTTGARPSATAYLIRTADLTVRTPHVADALGKARALVTEAGGYSGDEDTSVDSAGHEESTIQLRVPPAAYDRLLTELGGLGTLLDRKVSVEDVTGKVVDVQSRIRSQQASLARVRQLMDRAGSLAAVVTLEGELSTREADLESLQAQQAALRSQTDLATVTLRLTEPPVRPAPPKPDKHDGFWTSVGNALGDGWHAFYVAVRAILVVLSVLLPFLAVALLAAVAYRLIRRWWPRTAPPPPGVPAPLRAPDGLPRHPPTGPEPTGVGRTGAKPEEEPPAG